MDLSKNIFREYDIRGIYGEDLTDECAYHIGRALAVLYHEKGFTKICVGRDNRESSAPMGEQLIKGLVESGMLVTYAGIIPFPMTHFLSCVGTDVLGMEFDGGVNITASHNPKQYNGIKAEYRGAQPLSGDEIQRLWQIIKAENYITGRGSVVMKDFRETYISTIAKKFKYKNKYSVLVACGNGATCNVNPQILERTGVELVKLDCIADSTFPHNISNPEDPAQMQRVANEVANVHVDIGFMFDGDGDRLGVIDETGTFYKTDRILLLLAKDLLERCPGCEVLYDVKSSALVNEVVSKYGGVATMIPTGRTSFLRELLGGRAVLGAEFSGHIYIKDDYFGYDDGVFAACSILQILDESGKKLSELMAQFPTRPCTPELQIPCADNKKFEVIKDLTHKVLDEAAAGRYKKVETIDGVRVSVSDTNWFLIRAKNTSPFLAVRAEGNSDVEVASLLENVIRLLSPYGSVDLSKLR